MVPVSQFTRRRPKGPGWYVNFRCQLFLRFGFSSDIGDHGAHDLHFYVLGNLNINSVAVVGYLDDGSYQTTRGDDCLLYTSPSPRD